MLIEVTTKNAAAKKIYMQKLIQAFIDEKMKTYRGLEEQDAKNSEEQLSERTKYIASLWMIGAVTGVLQPEEIARQAGISCSLLQGWEDDMAFAALVEYSYQELLTYIVNLHA
jgi:hypothetical protein